MINELIEKLNITLPREGLEALEFHHKKQKNQSFFLRLMDVEEILEVVDYMSDIEVLQGLVPLWTDDNSNYICVHVQGACKYKVSYMNHEETDLSPRFRSIRSFIDELESNSASDWDELKKDYPSETDNRLESEEDLKCISDLNALIGSNEELSDELRCQSIFAILALTPKDHLDSIVKYLDDEDMYVQERACEIIGHHRYLPAKDKLTEVSEFGMHNGKMAAQQTLAKLRSNGK
ncbi:SMI1/KNR4 family protein [Paenibacillus sp. JDR-2]|uniref:SMI1/KNR4 family protein n=1 Tax=Paenibacillus sp. (strain JDR-2) TaxID=324057 RepID=UPI0001664980|nr:SMI1/KNR4 family protein [Paenibacillus sp. JDR-2]ACT04232.1 hypothetical protein Pjdr2_5624 [Paenibacillus sp. JDR-2]